MAQGKCAGYIYGIIDPISKEIVFVGNSFQPWESIKRHTMGGAGNPELNRWLGKLISGQPIQVLTDVVIDRYEGKTIRYPPIPNGVVRLEWKVLAEEPITFEKTSSTLKRQIIRELKAKGEAWFNKTPGRREGYTLTMLQAMKKEREARQTQTKQEILESLTD